MRMLLAIGFVLLSFSTVCASEYKIDASHSSVSFKIKHLAISTVFGRFTDFKGNFSYDP
ncbi:MAG: hypothetical protein GYA55_10385, partial [SAR324 cluster bacterium]|nr:hypothetical protein [SAR324 cluster bacterium]